MDAELMRRLEFVRATHPGEDASRVCVAFGPVVEAMRAWSDGCVRSSFDAYWCEAHGADMEDGALACRGRRPND